MTSGTCSESRRLVAILPALALLLVSAFGIGAMTYGNPVPDAQMAVIGPPWWKEDRMASLVAAAGGRMIAGGALPNIIVVRRAPEGERRPDEPEDLVAALYAAGAWLVLDAPTQRSCRGLVDNGKGAI
ncbi:hypothetical protein [Rhizobium rhizogenes]|uniref:hypothetical protein n=1 Tax=Rhizobium rhizogenes TaxID=359 RepID=UPI00080F9869|nr:hypothetical protein [Rhizobium rhizogenes]NTI44792.1 hypothetical protein [Rhizobium rhizogenes]OCJ23546.1 hypothetical protein A6U88_28035 [Agrobacterium sp. B131/95]